MKNAEYYDQAYRQLISDPENEGWRWLEDRVDKIAPLIEGNSVLDLGCGLAVIADAVDIAYSGIDYSRVAFEWNLANIKNPDAHFYMGDILNIRRIEIMRFNTVLLLEVLEHVHDPARLCQIAIEAAEKRVIVTVPQDMPGKAHIKPKWTRADLQDILGSCLIWGFGGEKADRWWCAVKDI